MPANTAPHTIPSMLWRGARGRCPHCGEGALFQSYLKPKPECPVCHEDFTRIRADDGPAWLTIIVTLHIIVPVAITLAMHDYMPQIVALGLLLILTMAVVMLLLPRAKGIFIAMIWWLAQRKHAPAKNRFG